MWTLVSFGGTFPQKLNSHIHKIADKVAERQLEISEKSNEKIIKRIETFWLYFL